MSKENAQLDTKIKVSDYVLNFLANKGIKEAFLLTGGGAMHLNDSLRQCTDIRYTCFLHEQAAAIAADSYFQFTNTPALLMVTSGPGSTNAITGVTASYFDSSSVIVISGQAKTSDLKGDSGVRQMGSQEVDIPSMVESITKYTISVRDPQKIKKYLETAWRQATTGRKGPVWIEIPLDIQAALIDENKLEEPEISFEKETSDLKIEVRKIFELLKNSKRPLFLAGNGIKLSDSLEAFTSFIENNNIPSLLTWKTIDFFDFDHPLNFGCPGIMGSRSANFILQNCDLLICLGSRVDASLTAFDEKKFAKNAIKVIVDIDENELNKFSTAYSLIAADAGDFLAELIAIQDKEKIVLPVYDEWLEYAQRLKECYPIDREVGTEAEDGIDLYAFTIELFNKLKSNDLITPESSGLAGEVTYQAMRIKKGQKVRNAAALGSMGFALPYAIGAALAYEKRRTILIDGDGALQMNIQELETVARLNLQIKIFVLDNGGYTSIANTQNAFFGGDHIGVDAKSGLTFPH